MSEKTILTSSAERKKKGKVELDPVQSWTVLGWIGIVFLVVGGLDFALTWFPLSFGNREWEFATVTGSYNHLPIILLGVGLLYAASVQSANRWMAAVALLASGVLVVWIVGGTIIWMTNVPLALQATPPEVTAGIRKALVKTGTQSLAYTLILAFVATRAFQAVRGID